MKPFSYLFAWTVILSCLVVGSSLAGDSDMRNALLPGTTEVHSETADSAKASTHFQNIEGTLKEIEGNVYVVESDKTQQSIRVEIGQATAFPNGKKKPGQLVQALISTSDGHALIIR